MDVYKIFLSKEWISQNMDDDDGGNRVEQDDWLPQNVLRVWRSGGGGRALTTCIAVGDIYRSNDFALANIRRIGLFFTSKNALIISARIS